jgi:TPR repeat protein
MFALRVIAARSPACSIQRCLFSSVSPSDLFTKYQDLAKSASLALESKRALEAAKQADVVDKVKNKNVANPGMAVIKTIVKQTRADVKEREKKEKESAASLLEDVVITKTDFKAEKAAADAREAARDPSEDPHYWLLKAAAAGHQEALILLGNHHLNLGNNAAKAEEKLSEINKAVECYEKSEHPAGHFNLGSIYYEGSCGIPVDTARGFDYFRRAADVGDIDACYFLGVTTDDIGLIKKAEEGNHSGALYYMALHRYGECDDVGGGEEESEEESVKRREQRFRKEITAAAEAGSGDAMGVVGSCHFHGEDGFSIDHKVALEWWLKAADAGHADSAVSAGALLFNGSPPGGAGKTSILVNRQHAFQMYQLGGELGSLDGWRNVAACYEMGEGVKRCEKSARYIVDTMLKK